MKFGLTGTARALRFRGHEVPYHIARERDLELVDCRSRLFVRGLCGAVLMELHPSSPVHPRPPLCKRCEEMSGVSKRRLRT